MTHEDALALIEAVKSVYSVLNAILWAGTAYGAITLLMRPGK